eukprot:756010-Prorocentrum_minimum.AAC.3
MDGQDAESDGEGWPFAVDPSTIHREDPTCSIEPSSESGHVTFVGWGSRFHSWSSGSKEDRSVYPPPPPTNTCPPVALLNLASTQPIPYGAQSRLNRERPPCQFKSTISNSISPEANLCWAHPACHQRLEAPLRPKRPRRIFRTLTDTSGLFRTLPDSFGLAVSRRGRRCGAEPTGADAGWHALVHPIAP